MKLNLILLLYFCYPYRYTDAFIHKLPCVRLKKKNIKGFYRTSLRTSFKKIDKIKEMHVIERNMSMRITEQAILILNDNFNSFKWEINYTEFIISFIIISFVILKKKNNQDKELLALFFLYHNSILFIETLLLPYCLIILIKLNLN